MFGGGKAAEKPEAPQTEPGGAQPAEKASWWSRLSGGLSRTSQSIVQGVADVFTKRKLDSLTLEELEDVLLRARMRRTASGSISFS